MKLFFTLEYAIKGLFARIGRVLIISGILAISTMLILVLQSGISVFQKIEEQALSSPKAFTSIDIRLQDPHMQGSQDIEQKKFSDEDFQSLFIDQRVRLINSHIYILAKHIIINGREISDQGIAKEIPTELRSNVRIATGRNIEKPGEVIIGEDWLTFSNPPLHSSDVLNKTISIDVPSFFDPEKKKKYDFLIVGIQDKNDIDSDAIKISENEAQRIFNTAKDIAVDTNVPRTNAGNIIVQLKSSNDVLRFSQDWEKKGYFIQNNQDVLQLIRQSYQKYQRYIYFISFLILAVISFIIFLIMNLIVRERYREIGIMKALGARRKTIQLLHLTQGSLLSLVGSFLGTFIFVILIFLVRSNFFPTLPKELSIVTVDWLMIVLFNTLFLLFSLIGSFLPAKKAASLDPVEAISSI